MDTGFWWNGVIDVKEDEDTESVKARINFEYSHSSFPLNVLVALVSFLWFNDTVAKAQTVSFPFYKRFQCVSLTATL